MIVHQKVTEQRMGDRIYDMARKAVILSAKDALSLFLKKPKESHNSWIRKWVTLIILNSNFKSGTNNGSWPITFVVNITLYHFLVN
jgi:hypothetical protein